MDFPLELLAPSVAARSGTWARLGVTCEVRPVAPNYGKAVVVCEFESADWLGNLMIWVTGETELATIDTVHDRSVNKHYDLTAPADLDALLDELVALLADGRIPDAALIF
ncbi:hypothetical protein [Actinoplanes aureus]|uniref:Uncharacterized protein n=1 Tax=Actinoplanes aureus TaxID=2792083 RepID=A0A931CCI8_9ACTN|nr:hypothetical protein [Actinoplanes aureus]MBG0567564.1 hypothetical protein [Actinoplanes aureus]